MIVKMKFISLTGPKYDFDRVTGTYLSKHEIQLENALSELKTVDNLQPFAEANPYKDALAKANLFVSYLKDQTGGSPDTVLTSDELFQTIQAAHMLYLDIKEKESALHAELDILKDKLKVIEPFKSLDINVHQVLQYRFVKFRFGRISLDYFHKLEKYIYEDLNIIFFEGGRDTSYVYGVYFVSREQSKKLDTILKSMHFERLFLPDDYSGSPVESCQELQQKMNELIAKIDSIDDEIAALFQENAARLLSAQAQLQVLSNNFDIRKVAAYVKDKREDYYIICGWMAERDVEELLVEVKDDPNLFVLVEEDREQYFGEPPTKLKNPKLFKPFEMFIRMYGLPAHNEMDPTIFVSLTYTFIFGIMFGDLGQGACLFLGGALLYKLKKVSLAGIISLAGIFSMFFGWMFGSVFGFENIIEARWMRPISAMTDLPFVGRLNTVFIIAVAFGMGIILLSMIFHIINAVRAHDTESTWFDHNGVAGLVFYGSIVATLVLFMTGHNTPAAIVLVVMFGLPLLLILFKEPLTRAILKQKSDSSESKVMFLVQGIFELFEVLLSYFSNTLSFVRIGAFAVSHAAIMEVVLILSGAETGSVNWIVIILGNIVVCGMEGLIVGIQVLRLEYYEMFSRFYKGTGREFKPYSSTKKTNN